MINMMAMTMNKMQLTMRDIMTAHANIQETIWSLQDQVLSVKTSIDDNTPEQRILKQNMDYLRLLPEVLNFNPPCCLKW